MRKPTKPCLETLEDRLAPAVTFTYAGPAGGGDDLIWENNATWTSVPATADYPGHAGSGRTDDAVVLTGTGIGRNLRAVDAHAIGSLTVSSGFRRDLFLYGTLTLTQDSTINADQNFDIVQTSAAVQLNIYSGTTTWTQGELNYASMGHVASTLEVLSGATFRINATTSQTFGSTIHVDSGGFLYMDQSADIKLYDGAGVDNYGRWYFDSTGGIARFNGGDAYKTLANFGHLTKDNNNAEVTVDEPIGTTGFLSVRQGTLTFKGNTADTNNCSFYWGDGFVLVHDGCTLGADAGFWLAATPNAHFFTIVTGHGGSSTLSTNGFVNMESGILNVGTTDAGLSDYGTLNITGTGGFKWDGGSISFSYSTATSTPSEIKMGATTTGGFTVNQNTPTTCRMPLQIIGGAVNPSPLAVVDNTAGMGGVTTGLFVNPAPGGYSGDVVEGEVYIVVLNPAPTPPPAADVLPAWGWSIDPLMLEVLAGVRKEAA
jgi:hypothetical protein